MASTAARSASFGDDMDGSLQAIDRLLRNQWQVKVVIRNC